MPNFPTPIASIIIGGGVRNCTSSAGATNGPHAMADWDTILAQDPAFAGISREEVVFSRDAAQRSFHCAINAASLQRVAEVPDALLPQGVRAQATLHLGRFPRQDEAVAPAEVLRHLQQHMQDDRGEHQGLEPAQWAVIAHCLAPTHAPAPRKRELRTVRFLADPHARSIYETIVAAARACRGVAEPCIGIVTAASDNPHEEADINVYALRSAGAHAVYLPLNGGLRRALDNGHEAVADLYYEAYANTHTEHPIVHSSLRFADYAAQHRALACQGGHALNQLLESLDGIYFSGGDQSRILEAWVTPDDNGHFTQASIQLRILRKRFAAGQLIVAGTSAGNHIQGGGWWRGHPVPMLGGGDSYAALTRGFEVGRGSALETPARAHLYHHGGLGTFSFGVLDSHFSERCREGRLARATLDSGMDYGFGVDENTALVVHRPDAQGATSMSVRGEHGVWIVDARTVCQTPRQDPALEATDFIAHYLHEGDTLHIDADGDLHVALDPRRSTLGEVNDFPALHWNRIQDYGSHRLADLAARMGRSGAHSAVGTTQDSADGRTVQDRPLMRIDLTRVATTCFRADNDHVSYTALRVGFSPLNSDTL
jgi:cyanophycinase